jgi:protein-disulfide isomerase-like protein with CxxC motif
MPVLEAPLPAKEQVEDRLPAPGREGDGRDGTAEILQHCLDLAVTGNLAAAKTLRKLAATIDRVAPIDTVGAAGQLELIQGALEMTQRVAHAPFDLGRTLVHTAVLVNVDVDVDVASRQNALQTSDQEER